MKTERQRPLHRLTPLRSDPIASWLSPSEKFSLDVGDWLGWVVFVFGLIAIWVVSVMVIAYTLIFDVRLPTVVVIMLGIALVNPVRRTILRRRTAKAAEIVLQSVPAEALALDDWTALENEPDGRLVSVVGWARGKDHLGQQVNGEVCIGMAVGCQQKYPGLMETLHDLELFDEAGQTISVRVEGARMLGKPNTNIGGGTNQMLLVASLDLPVGAVLSSWDAFVIRDGDPLMVVGFKQTVVEPGMFGIRQAPSRPQLVSSPPRPLLIFPIAAERRTSGQ
jgi:hypothetical protein